MREIYHQLKQATDALREQYQIIREHALEVSSLKTRLEEIDVYEGDSDRIDRELANLIEILTLRANAAKVFIGETRNLYTDSQNVVPSGISQEFINLELNLENTSAIGEDKMRSAKKARSIRSEYLNNVDEVNQWIRIAVEKINDPRIEPTQCKEILNKLYNEQQLVGDRLQCAKKCGELIVENSQSEDERMLIKHTIDQLENQLADITALLADKRNQIDNTLEGWSRFLYMHRGVLDWCNDKRNMLSQPMVIGTIQEAKQKQAEYSSAVKSVKPINKFLSDMDKELDEIAKITTVAELRLKMQEAEEAKIFVEGKLLERNSLLMETSEEWEQCDKKMKDVRIWMDKAKSNLESPNSKKKPLRDQIGINEKTLADIIAQKTKINMSIEKLQVYNQTISKCVRFE